MPQPKHQMLILSVNTSFSVDLCVCRNPIQGEEGVVSPQLSVFLLLYFVRLSLTFFFDLLSGKKKDLQEVFSSFFFFFFL